MMEDEIFLFPFGVAVQLMGDGHYEVLLRREDENVTGIAIVLGEHEAFKENDDEEEISLEDVEVPRLNHQNTALPDDVFLTNILQAMRLFYVNDQKSLKYSIPIEEEKVEHKLFLYDYSSSIQNYQVSVESPCPEARIQSFETNHFAIPEWYKGILRICTVCVFPKS